MNSKLQITILKLSLFLFTITTFFAYSEELINQKKYVFVENKGQFPANIKYVGYGNNSKILLTDDAILYDFNLRDENSFKGHVIEMKFSGSNKLNKVELGISESKRNYFIGNNQNKWIYGVKEFSEISIKNVYNGIDTKLYFDEGNPRYDFIINQNADPSQISISLNGQDDYYVNQQNEIILKTSLGEIKHSKLLSYQNINNNITTVKSKFMINNGFIKFDVGDYDKSKPLVIDPIVVASYLGGSSIDEAKSVKSIGDTSYVIAGWTESADLVSIVGSYQSQYGLNRDAFVAKYKIINGNLSLLVTTFLGSAGKDEAKAIDIDFEGSIYIAGNTTSSDFPNVNGLNNVYKGLSDMFVTKFSSDLSKVLVSNIFGGTSDDFLNCMVVDTKAAVLFGGQTSSSNYFTKASVQPNIKLRSDGFITRLNENGKLIDFSSFLGGSDDDVLNAIALFPNGDIGLVGSTLSTDFTIFPNVYVAPKIFPPDPGYTQKPYDDSHNGGWDVFIAKISGDGSSYDYSSFFGGSGDDFGKSGIGLLDGTLLFAGESKKETQTAKFPTSDSPFQKVNKGGFDLFLAQMGAEVVTTGKNKSQLLTFSTFIGGAGDEELSYITTNSLIGSICMVGRTKSSDFPKKLPSGETSKYAGGYDGFICEMNNSGIAQIYGALFGGANDDAINSISYDIYGDFYIAGSTQSSNVTSFGSSTINGTSDAFSAKYVVGSLGITSPSPGGTYCNGSNLNIDWASQDLSNNGFILELGRKSTNTFTTLASKIKISPFSWKIPNNITPANDYYIKISHQSGAVSNLNGTFKINSPPIINSILLDKSSSTFICEGKTIKIIADATGSNLTYQWKLNGKDIPNLTSNTLTVDKAMPINSGDYSVIAKGECAPDPESKILTIQVEPKAKFQNQLADAQMETGKEFILVATSVGSNLKYKWQKDNNDIIGQTTNILLITKPVAADAGKYRCIVEGQCGNDTTNQANITLKALGDVYYSNEKSDKITFRYLSENSITIQLCNLLDGNVRLNLYNTNGQLISNLLDQNYYYGVLSCELNTENLTTGLYYLKLENVNQSTLKTIQVIK